MKLLLPLLLAGLWVAIATAGFLALRALLPGLSPTAAAVGATALLAGFAALAAAATGWRATSPAGRASGADWRLFLLPALITLLPLAGGIKPVAADTLGLLLVGYALTGFAEETMFRGVVLARLLPLGPLRAAAIASVLFGLVHLANIVIRGNPPVILAQAVGAACFGFGYAAVRLRTGLLWPLMALHLLTDLFLQLGALPLIPVAVVQDVILLGYGLLLIGRRPGTATGTEPGRG